MAVNMFGRETERGRKTKKKSNRRDGLLAVGRENEATATATASGHCIPENVSNSQQSVSVFFLSHSETKRICLVNSRSPSLTHCRVLGHRKKSI